jgi:hypothetical protein
MSLLTIPGAAQAALPQATLRPHGHRHGSHLESTADSDTSTAAQVPAGTAQNAFGSLLQSLEQVIGVQPTASTTGSASAATPSAATAATTPAQAASTQLQNYLKNAAQTVGNSIRLNV